MTREDRMIWEDLDEDEKLDAYSAALQDLAVMTGRYESVRAQLNSMIEAITKRATVEGGNAGND